MLETNAQPEAKKGIIEEPKPTRRKQAQLLLLTQFLVMADLMHLLSETIVDF